MKKKDELLSHPDSTFDKVPPSLARRNAWFYRGSIPAPIFFDLNMHLAYSLGAASVFRLFQPLRGKFRYFLPAWFTEHPVRVTGEFPEGGDRRYFFATLHTTEAGVIPSCVPAATGVGQVIFEASTVVAGPRYSGQPPIWKMARLDSGTCRA